MIATELVWIAGIRKEDGKLINSAWNKYSKVENDQELKFEMLNRVFNLQMEPNEAIWEVRIQFHFTPPTHMVLLPDQSLRHE
jgi:hypothetical protein